MPVKAQTPHGEHPVNGVTRVCEHNERATAHVHLVYLYPWRGLFGGIFLGAAYGQDVPVCGR